MTPSITTRGALLAAAITALASCAAPRVEPEPLRILAPPASAPASQPVDELAFWRGRRDLIKSPPSQPAAALQVPGLRRLTLKNGL